MGLTVARCARLPQELGIEESVDALVAATAKPPAPKRETKKRDAPSEPLEQRKSGRARTEHNYAQMIAEIDHIGREPRGEPIDYAARIAALQLDPAAAERLRAELEAKRASRGGGEGRVVGPKDSGKGVRVQVGQATAALQPLACACAACC